MTPEEQLATKYDKVFQDQTVKRTLRTKADIFDKLKASVPAGEIQGTLDNLTVASLREIAKKHGVRLFEIEVKTQKGWLGAKRGHSRCVFSED